MAKFDAKISCRREGGKKEVSPGGISETSCCCSRGDIPHGGALEEAVPLL